MSPSSTSAQQRLRVLEIEQRPLSQSRDDKRKDVNVSSIHALRISGRRQPASSMVVCFSLTFVFVLAHFLSKTNDEGYDRTVQLKRDDGVLHFECPATRVRAANDDHSFNKDYEEVSKQLSKQNVTDFLATFRQQKFDAWGKSYEYVKGQMYDWKRKQIAPYLRHGDRIYESACGIGLNLYMTLEIVYETTGVDGLIVYGNEYVPPSTDQANAIFDHGPPHNSTKGLICTGDSSQITSFVPAESFDVVYTGYLSTLMDPLHFNLPKNILNFRRYEKLCHEADSENPNSEEWKSTLLNNITQRRQEDWFANWVNEMIHIAKPGAPVVIEQVSQPFCTDMSDWGGVPKEWWPIAIDRYGWEVNATSLVMQDDRVFSDEYTPKRERRYHVFMLKLGRRAD